MNRNGMDFAFWSFATATEILLQSRDQKSLNRYFPELIESLQSQLPDRCVLDGEIVIARERCARLRSPFSFGFTLPLQG